MPDGAMARLGAPSRLRKAISDGTIIKELVTLRTALRWSQSMGWIDKVPYIETPRTPARRDCWLTKTEFQRLLGNKGRSTVPVVPELLSALKDAAFMRTTDWVIESRGDRIRKIKTAFNKRVKAAGLVRVTPHTLRHTCATWMVMGGVPFEMVAKYLGNSVDMVERVYGHHSPDWLRRAAASGFSVPTGTENVPAHAEEK